jgi:flavin reductase (DIM6/NTAB) family NADH-FMN oxidoreductase RutF
MNSFEPKDVNVGKLHQLLLTVVSPRPIAWASTVSEDGVPNLAPFSFFNVFSANPPILIFSPARRVRNNTTKHTLDNVLNTKEVVINMISYDLVYQASLSSTDYDEGVNEFDKCGLTMLESDLVKPFRVAESPVQLECKVSEVIALGDEGGAGNLVICELVKIHIVDEVMNEEGHIDQYKLDIVSRAGGSFYSRAKLGFFEIPKPIATMGIGVDAMPENVRNSMILTGNDLGMLANIEALPTEEAILNFVKEVSQRYPDIETMPHREKHKMAQNYLSYGDIDSAWKLLLS